MLSDTLPDLISLTGIRRRFGPLVAVDDVSISFRSGQIVALLGHNGAGKSTLMNVLSGTVKPDRGAISIDGHEVRSWSTARAAAAGVVMVHQNFKLVPNFTVAENLALASQTIPGLFSPSHLRSFAETTIEESGIRLEGAGRRVTELSVGEQSKVELIKALARKPRLLILDEPTSVLTAGESDELFAILRSQAVRGLAVVLVTHKLSEVMAVADRIVVMRDGHIVLDGKKGSLSRADIASAMHLPTEPARPARGRTPGQILLEVRGVSTPAEHRTLALRNLTLSIREGEIVAVVGAAGNGQQELARLVRGLIEPASGSIVVDGTQADRPSLFRRADIAHIPPDRAVEGIIAEMSLSENLALRSRDGMAAQREIAASIVSRFAIRATSIDQPAGSLSGGNQQKLLLGRELEANPRIIIASDPTRGLDPGAAEMIRAQLSSAVSDGAALLLITSDTDEALELADGIHVLYRGELSERLEPSKAASQLGSRMAGVS